jgi:hypothetical protein
MISDRGNQKRSEPGAQGGPLADAHETAPFINREIRRK